MRAVRSSRVRPELGRWRHGLLAVWPPFFPTPPWSVFDLVSVSTAALLHPGEVLEADRGGLGAAEGSGVPHLQKGTIPYAARVRRQMHQHPEEMRGLARHLCLVCRAWHRRMPFRVSPTATSEMVAGKPGPLPDARLGDRGGAGGWRPVRRCRRPRSQGSKVGKKWCQSAA